MNADQIFVSVKGKPVTGVQLFAPHGADLAVDEHIAFLNFIFGAAAGGNNVGKLHGRFQLNKLRSDDHRNGRILLFDSYFHAITRS